MAFMTRGLSLNLNIAKFATKTPHIAQLNNKYTEKILLATQFLAINNTFNTRYATYNNNYIFKKEQYRAVKFYSTETKTETKESETKETPTTETKQNETQEVEINTQPPKEEVPKVDPKDAEISELKTRLLYALAEKENLRKLAKVDVENAKSYGVSKFALEILEVTDNLTRALQTVPATQKNESKVLENFYEGVEMTNRILHKTLTNYNIKPFHPIGEKFNPNTMEAVLNMPGDDSNHNTAGIVVKDGYHIGERLLRPAQVGVFKKAITNGLQLQR